MDNELLSILDILNSNANNKINANAKEYADEILSIQDERKNLEIIINQLESETLQEKDNNKKTIANTFTSMWNVYVQDNINYSNFIKKFMEDFNKEKNTLEKNISEYVINKNLLEEKLDEVNNKINNLVSESKKHMPIEFDFLQKEKEKISKELTTLNHIILQSENTLKDMKSNGVEKVKEAKEKQELFRKNEAEIREHYLSLDNNVVNQNKEKLALAKARLKEIDDRENLLSLNPKLIREEIIAKLNNKVSFEDIKDSLLKYKMILSNSTSSDLDNNIDYNKRISDLEQETIILESNLSNKANYYDKSLERKYEGLSNAYSNKIKENENAILAQKQILKHSSTSYLNNLKLESENKLNMYDKQHNDILKLSILKTNDSIEERKFISDELAKINSKIQEEKAKYQYLIDNSDRLKSDYDRSIRLAKITISGLTYENNKLLVEKDLIDKRILEKDFFMETKIIEDKLLLINKKEELNNLKRESSYLSINVNELIKKFADIYNKNNVLAIEDKAKDISKIAVEDRLLITDDKNYKVPSDEVISPAIEKKEEKLNITDNDTYNTENSQITSEENYDFGELDDDIEIVEIKEAPKNFNKDILSIMPKAEIGILESITGIVREKWDVFKGHLANFYKSTVSNVTSVLEQISIEDNKQSLVNENIDNSHKRR